jgi:predicted O-methyltransferase YrrM
MKETKIIDERIAFTQYEPEFEILLEHYIDLKAKNVLEIGSYFGASLHHWLYYSTEKARIISIDLPISEFCGSHDPRVPVQEFAIKNEWKLWTKRNNNKLHLIQHSSQLENTKKQVENLLNNDQLDFLFIDGDHRYEAVKNDYDMYSSLVKKGGKIALHDINYAEEGGVHKLWDDLKQNYEHLELRLHPKKEKGIGIIFI